VRLGEPLLAELEGQAWHSGAELARRLGVSRAAIWKRISRLRGRGYRIEGSAGKGYRLVHLSDRLLPAEIARSYAPRRFAGEIVYRDEIDSTNRLAAELARDGAPEGTVVVAERQTAGRGRLGRSWASPGFLNLYCSVILRPALAPAEVPQLTLVAAVALAEACAATIEVAPAIKWPNDLLLHGRKAAGILTELDAEPERVRFVIVGIGVNLNAGRDDFPPELRRKATSLALASGRTIDRASFAGRLLTRLDRRYAEFCRGGFAKIAPAYEGYHCLAGRRVRVEGGVQLVGTVLGIDASGALLVKDGARIERVVAGEVTLTRSYRALRGKALAISRRRA